MGGYSIIGHLAPVRLDFVGGSKTPGADQQCRLGKDRHCIRYQPPEVSFIRIQLDPLDAIFTRRDPEMPPLVIFIAV
jgi:hypothetical protein